MAAPVDLNKSPVLAPGEPRTFLQALDAGVYIVERGVVTFALLAMALTYFYDILHVEMTAQDNAFVRVVYRLAGYSAYQQPPESLREAARGWIGPLIVGVGALGLAWFAVYTADRERRRLGQGARFAVAVGVTAAFYGFGRLIELAPSRWICIGTYLIAMGWFTRLYSQRGQLAIFLTAWVPASAYILSILWNLRPGYSWSQDLAKILIMWVGFVGASMATHDGKHIRIDFVRKAIPQRFLSAYNALSHLVTMSFCALLLVLAVWYLLDRLRMGATLASIDLQVWLVVLPIPLALTVMVVRFGARFIVALRGEDSTAGEGSH